ncbi:8601_t:CDS:1, partial [Funneliformis geosporum]
EEASKGWAVRPLIAVRELGLERRETVWSLSVVGVGNLRRSALSTQGPEWTDQWFTSCHVNGMAG